MHKSYEEITFIWRLFIKWIPASKEIIQCDFKGISNIIIITYIIILYITNVLRMHNENI